jgi:hypothetical protein
VAAPATAHNQEISMRARRLFAVTVTVTTLMLAGGASADLKKTAYPIVKVEIAEAYKPDAAFTNMRKALIEATRKKDATALFALVAPGFVWNGDGALSNEFDPGREPLHNFKVLFGFREIGKNADGPVDGGPYWDSLSAFAAEDTYNQTDQAGSLVCGPISASVEDEDVFAKAGERIETADDSAEWYFTLRDTPVATKPGDKGPPIATLKQQAVPVLSSFPVAREGQPEPTATHYEVLLPSGKVGWIPAAAARPLEATRLCYALTASGEWKIGLYDGVGE